MKVKTTSSLDEVSPAAFSIYVSEAPAAIVVLPVSPLSNSNHLPVSGVVRSTVAPLGAVTVRVKVFVDNNPKSTVQVPSNSVTAPDALSVKLTVGLALLGVISSVEVTVSSVAFLNVTVTAVQAVRDVAVGITILNIP